MMHARVAWHGNPLRCPNEPLFCNNFLESAPSPERLLILDLLQQRAGKGHGNVFSQMYACFDPRATNHASRCMMAKESNCTTQYEINAHINTTRPRLHHG
ncbi:hypothetical protein CsSME_00005616 [Camellia sinensis var. sinensis]